MFSYLRNIPYCGTVGICTTASCSFGNPCRVADTFPFEITKMLIGMNKQAVLVETLNGLETVPATGSGKLMKKRYEDALDNQSDGGNKIRVLSNFVINFAASVQQYAQVAAIFFGVYLIVEGTITQGALIGAVILGGRTMAPLSQLANTLAK